MKICLDAGHYGKYNRSPVNYAYYESDFSWKYHLLLKAELEKYGVMVITTRTAQAKDLALEARGKKAKGCDLFLSLHSNACGLPNVDYPLACCTVTGKANALGQKLANCVAEVMQTKQNGRIINRKGNGGSDYYGVLRGAASVGVPGILLEHSFHTNLKATNWLLDEANLKRMAAAEAQVIAEHYGLKKGTAEPTPIPTATPDPEGSFKVKVVCNSLNVRSGPGINYQVKLIVKKNEVYTIVETKDGWGKLKSGAGWINISSTYVKRV